MTPKLYIDPRAPDTRIKSPYIVFCKKSDRDFVFIDIDSLFLFNLHHVAHQFYRVCAANSKIKIYDKQNEFICGGKYSKYTYADLNTDSEVLK